MAITNKATSKYPNYISQLLAVAAKIRTYKSFKENRVAGLKRQPSNTMYGSQFDAIMAAITGFVEVVKTRMNQDINSIRGVINTNPIYAIDPIFPPDPDPIDGYYYPESKFVFVNDSFPTAMSLLASTPTTESTELRPLGMSLLPEIRDMGDIRVLPLPLPRPRPPIRPRPIPPWPWPPWPLPPPAPPPVNWCVPAEEDYSYICAYKSIIAAQLADRKPTSMDFEYWGYFLMEYLKRCYELDRFAHTEKDTAVFFKPLIPRLSRILATQ